MEEIGCETNNDIAKKKNVFSVMKHKTFMNFGILKKIMVFRHIIDFIDNIWLHDGL